MISSPKYKIYFHINYLFLYFILIHLPHPISLHTTSFPRLLFITIYWSYFYFDFKDFEFDSFNFLVAWFILFAVLEIELLPLWLLLVCFLRSFVWLFHLWLGFILCCFDCFWIWFIDCLNLWSKCWSLENCYLVWSIVAFSLICPKIWN